MSDDSSPTGNPQLEARLRILKFLCLLTFAGSGLGALSYGFIGTFYNLFSSMSTTALADEQQDIIKMLMSGGRYFFILNSLLYSISFTGAYMMWKMKKAGFHCYTISQILILISPLAFITDFHMPGINVILTALFIFAYSGFFKTMH
ncbi:MAG: hypothetical protein IPH88_04690 [Bacteroidales bacterium]|nr:hypothetical protein [Bacteroidales bacterium]